MRNTNANTQTDTKRKLTVIITSLAAGLFSATSYSSVVQVTELVKAEPIQQINLYQDAKESLALSFDNLTINPKFNDESAKDTMAKQQNSIEQNTPITLTKINLVSE